MKTNAEIISEARESLHQKWREVVMVSLIYLVLNIVVSTVTSFSPFVCVIASIAIAPLHVGFYRYALDIKKGIIGDYNVLFRWFKDGYLRVAITYFMMSIYVGLWTLLLVVPGIIMAISYSQTLFILASDDTITPQKALNKSQDMMRGYKMKYFLLNLRFMVLCLLTLGIGLIWLLPYMATAQAGFFNDLKANYKDDCPSCC